MVSVLVPSNSRQERRRRDRRPVRRRCRRRRRRAGDVRRADVRSRAGRDSMSRSARDEGERARRRYGQRVHQDAGRPGLPAAVVLNAGATAAGTSRRIVRARLESSGAFQLVRPRLTTVADRRGVRRSTVGEDVGRPSGSTTGGGGASRRRCDAHAARSATTGDFRRRRRFHRRRNYRLDDAAPQIWHFTRRPRSQQQRQRW